MGKLGSLFCSNQTNKLFAWPAFLYVLFGIYFPTGAFFKLFWTQAFVLQICQYTNEYFAEMKDTRPSLAKNWRDLEPEEFYTFLSLLMYFSLVRAPRLDLYWRTKLYFMDCGLGGLCLSLGTSRFSVY